ncbi:uncharacterized protein LOC136075538 [Hydra vulgaris]|uniref:Uncharacterized protein LOC136075538 n=1 Tax=Hydra vulgaris TaxID=6087 RepID=A0ABM4B853_HYDVU
MFNSIKENILPIHNLNIGIDISELQNELNPFLELCLCCKCNKIPQMPVTLKSCEHLFCFLCLVEEMKNKYIDETFCPKCNKKIYIDDMVTSKKTNSLLQMLTLVCNLCKQKFNALKEYEIFKTHKSLCHNELLLSTSLLTSSSNSKKSINDIFEINKDSDIPQELEEAALHIIKQKMAKSGQKTIEFKSGGPRPMVFTHAPKAYVNSAQAAQSTLRLRNTNNAKHFETLAGNLNDAVANQTSKLLNSLSQDTRHSILDNAGLNHSEISASVMVAMKTDMGVPWEKLKIMSRDNSIRVFIFGDYEFLCSLYGISGASGKHCCLFCYATTNEMKVCKKERTGIESRTLENLQADFERFMKDGGIKKKAKFYNNVIAEPILRIPLNQVSLPSLHIALGVYLKFFNMFEEEAHEVDIMMAASLKNKNCLLSQPYQDYILKQQKILNLKRCIDKLDDQIQLVNDTVAIAILNNEDCVENIQSLYIPQLNLLNETKMEKVRECNGLENELIFKKSEGPCIQQIELILQKLKVQRQAYHGKSFIGNHVHKMLKKKSILELCNSVPLLVYNNGLSGTTVHEKSVEISSKYKQLFNKLSNCYSILSSKSTMTIIELTQLETYVDDLMQFYHAKWPQGSVPPKLHMMEDHAIPFLQKWGAGFEFYGEQGGESIHHEFNKLKIIYQSIPSPTMRLKSILKSHHLKTNPKNRALRPKI